MRIKSTLIALTLTALTASGGQLVCPLDIPISLSSNFAELRPNHFHSGLDFKTKGVTGLDLLSVADGYVSKVSVSPWGYGRAVYIVHPKEKLISVYGHLESFNDTITSKVLARQIKDRSFSVTVEFKPGEVPVKAGDVIGKSGNAGYSFGPHLHFELRDSSNTYAIDPLPYYQYKIKDTASPEKRSLKLLAVEGKGVVDDMKAWGRVYPAIEAYERMSGVSNIFGIKKMTLSVDGKTVYTRETTKVKFDTNRAINTMIDYATLVDDDRLMMVTKVPISNPLGYMMQGDGVININEERPYKCEITLEDQFGNKTKVPFTIKGTKMSIPKANSNGYLAKWDKPLILKSENMILDIPVGSLYEDMRFIVKRGKMADYESSYLLTVGDEHIPVNESMTLRLRVANDNHPIKAQYCIVRLNSKDEPIFCGKGYNAGWVSARVNRFGRYVVAIDSIPPSIKAIDGKRWRKSGEIKIEISDDLSGIDSYEVEIDGQFVVMEYDGKNDLLTYKIDREKFPNNRNHKLKIWLKDGVGNRTLYKCNFV